MERGLIMATKVFVVVSSGDKEVVKGPALMYPLNATKRKWMDEVKVILFGPAEKLAAHDAEIQAKLDELRGAGIEIIACKALADAWNITGALEEKGIEVVYVGSIISQLIQDDWASITF